MAFRPVHGVSILALLVGGVLAFDMASGWSGRRFELVRPDRQGRVEIGVADLAPGQVRFYRFLNAGNQEVKFFVGRDERGGIQVAFDAAESDYKMKRGFRSDSGWMVNNKCDTAIRLSEVNAGRGGCAPIPIRFAVEGERIAIAEADLLAGWRYFR